VKSIAVVKDGAILEGLLHVDKDNGKSFPSQSQVDRQYFDISGNIVDISFYCYMMLP